jgi:hypothetical protein
MMGARTSQNKYSESNLNTMNVINMRLWEIYYIMRENQLKY